MRLAHLALQDFRAIGARREFNLAPQFNVVIGPPGAGKSSVLAALASAAAAVWLGLPRGADLRPLGDADTAAAGGTRSRAAGPVIEVHGELLGGPLLAWSRQAGAPATGTRGAPDGLAELRNRVRGVFGTRAAGAAGAAGAAEAEPTLPLIVGYGSERFSPVAARSRAKPTVAPSTAAERFRPAPDALDARLDAAALTQWVLALRPARATAAAKAVAAGVDAAVLAALQLTRPDITGLKRDHRRGELLIERSSGTPLAFAGLGHGSLALAALVADLAQRALALNPSLGPSALAGTPGLVLIDELELHLHPRAQRGVADLLRAHFPALQFVAASDSPFIVQSLRGGHELMMLAGQPTAELGNLSIEEIASGLMGVDQPTTGARYGAMRGAAREYLATLERAKAAPTDRLAAYEEALQSQLAPFADNPAFQAFLEMKRVARLGR
jgi:hypothetical protein